MKRGIIVLLTDFGLQDPYVAIMKGVIWSINPDVKIVDATHMIPRGGIKQAAFLLKGIYRYFPSGTVFCAVVDPGVGSPRKALSAESEGYFFVGPDNGIFSPVCQENTENRFYEISNPSYMLKNISGTFHGRDIFAPAAAHISLGISINELGPPVLSPAGLGLPPVVSEAGRISGTVVFEDHFGNLITDIDESLYKDRQVQKVLAGGYEIKGISRCYAESEEGTLTALTGSYGTLEIAVNNGSAAEILKDCKNPEVEILTLD